MKAEVKFSITSIRLTDSGQRKCADIKSKLSATEKLQRCGKQSTVQFSASLQQQASVYPLGARVHPVSIRFSLRINAIFMQFEI